MSLLRLKLTLENRWLQKLEMPVQVATGITSRIGEETARAFAKEVAIVGSLYASDIGASSFL